MSTKFAFDEKNFTITKIYTSDSEVVIPSTIDGHPVFILGPLCAKMVCIDKLIISEGIIRIGESAFSDCGIKEVSFPKSLIHIGAFAFYNNNISEVILPNVVMIDKSAFAVNSISSVTFGKLSVELGESAFEDNKIETCNLDNCSKFGNSCFKNNELKFVKLSNVTLGAHAFQNNKIEVADISVDYIPPGCFADNLIYDLIVITTSISPYAFSGNRIVDLTNLKALNIGEYAFDCNNIVKANVSSCKQIDKSAFGEACYIEFLFKDEKQYSDCIKKGRWGGNHNRITLESYSKEKQFDKLFQFSPETGGVCNYSKWGSNVTEVPTFFDEFVAWNIQPGTFKNSCVTSVTVNEGIEIICNNAFENSQIREVTLPKNLIEVQDYAFTNIVSPELVVNCYSSTKFSPKAFDLSTNVKFNYLNRNPLSL